jgi:hypothetical protein
MGVLSVEDERCCEPEWSFIRLKAFSRTAFNAEGGM